MKSKIAKALFSLVLTAFSSAAIAQSYPWQQAVDYTMNVSMDVKNHTFNGTQKLIYTNNSPDTLTRVYYHLYFNAFQPGSMMDVRSRTIIDPSSKIGDRISKLAPHEIGILEPTSLSQDQTPVKYSIEGTILEVELAKPILPNSSTVFDMHFKGQVPIQIRRSGRDNKEGIDYSMAQWYPKLSEYDADGWHPEPYIAREFYGVWGKFDVSITIDSDYVVAASGMLQNGNEIGYGYEDPGTKVKRRKKEITYHYIADNVHDFMWAADPDYVHKTVQVPDGPKMHYFYVEDTITEKTWPQLMDVSPKMVTYMSQQFGKYAYSDFFVIQGGDGGMEYPMSTLINGKGSVRGLIGVTIHEMFHSWYQGVLATNESLYPWMDEGFTSYASALTGQHLAGMKPSLERRFKAYLGLALSGKQEPMTTHSDHYNTNSAYGVAAYSMGSLIPYQLAYIMGEDIFHEAFRDYYYTWQFRHPSPSDFTRIMEKHSAMILDWFFLDWVGTTKHLDYAIGDVTEKDNQVNIELINRNQRPMPVELLVTFNDGHQERYYMPLIMMRGNKVFNDGIKTTQLPDWPWTNPSYSVTLDKNLSEISKIELDPNRGTADVDYSNNTWSRQNTNNE
jgi:hypothetical protein